jgi:hypothetical protein
MANRILSGTVLVQEAAARGEIEQRQAEQSRGASPQSSGTRLGEVSLHASSDYTTSASFDSANQLSVAYLPRPSCAFLTRQQFSPKLRLNRYMAVNRENGRVIALVLLMLFLGAQIHLLSDLESWQVGAHLCPVCSALTFAILFALPVLCSLPVIGRADDLATVGVALQAVSRLISPRAPPPAKSFRIPSSL